MGTWDTWKILILIAAGAALAGTVVGIIAGKSVVKRSRPGYRPLLSGKERAVCAASILLGLALIVFGFVYRFPQKGNPDPDEGILLAEEAAPAGRGARTAGAREAQTFIVRGGMIYI